MAREYFCAYHSYLKSMRNLSDAECGRLFRALLKYSSGEQSINLQGRESIAFDFITEQIDRDNAAYEAKCAQNRENRKGGNGQQPSTPDNDRRQPSTPVYKEKEKEKENVSPPYPPAGGTGDATLFPDAEEPPQAEPSPPKAKRGTHQKNPAPAQSPELNPDEESALLAYSPGLCNAVRDWLLYKAERRFQYKPKGRATLMSQICDSARQYGPDAMTMLIRQSIANGWQGIAWDKLSQPSYGSNSPQQRQSWVELLDNMEMEAEGRI